MEESGKHYVGYPRTGDLMTVPVATIEELEAIADSRVYASLGILFSLIGTCVFVALFWNQINHPNSLHEFLAAHASTYIFALLMNSSALDHIRKVSYWSSWWKSTLLLSLVVPASSFFISIFFLTWTDRYFRQRKIPVRILRPRHRDLANWIDHYENGRPPDVLP